MKFRYCCSQDELAWHIDDIPHPQVRLSPISILGKRILVQEWIEENCKMPVYVWVVPDEVLSTHFYFESEDDAILFRVTWL